MRISALAATMLAATMLAAALIAGCGSDAEPASPTAPSSEAADAAAPASGDAAVKIEDFVFAPKAVAVETGAEVSFENLDRAPHTATIAEGAMKFDTGTIEKGETKSVTFDKPGTYAYVCLFHPYMKGTVTVKG